MMPAPTPINMEDFRNAIHDWFSKATGLQTVWRDQSAPEPELPFASLRILNGPEAYSPTWEEREETDLNRPAGEEIKMTSTVPCRFVISCQVYVGLPDGRDPGLDALSYILRAKGALGLASYQADLREKNISVSRTGTVQNLTALQASEMESRANIDVTFNTVLAVEEYVGYIKKVHATAPELGIDQMFGVGVVI